MWANLIRQEDLKALLAVVRLCAVVTQQPVAQAFQQSRNRDKSGADFLTRYSACAKSTTAPVVGVQPSGTVEKPNRNLTVSFQLPNAERPYDVMVVFASDKIEDANVKFTSQSISQAFSDYFDFYGVGITFHAVK